MTILNVEDPLRQRGVDREYLCHIGCYDSKKIIIYEKNFFNVFLKARTNSCVDTLALRMANNHSKNGFGYKHRPGLLFDFIFIINK